MSGHNPFRNEKYSMNRITANQYAMLMQVADSIQDIKLIADNIKDLRSGNIELTMEDYILKWKYVNETEWKDLGDFNTLFNRIGVAEANILNIQSTLGTINGELLDIESRLYALENP